MDLDSQNPHNYGINSSSSNSSTSSITSFSSSSSSSSSSKQPSQRSRASNVRSKAEQAALVAKPSTDREHAMSGASVPRQLELVTVATLHRFHSRDWFVHLARTLPLDESAWGRIATLEPGHALLFAARHGLGGSRAGGGGPPGGQHGLFSVAVRARITADRGAVGRHAK